MSSSKKSYSYKVDAVPFIFVRETSNYKTMKAVMSIWIRSMLITLTIFSALSYGKLGENIGNAGENLALIESGYFPLSVGNVYTYHYGSSSGYNYNYQVRIISEVYIDSVKYYVADTFFPAYVGTLLRDDSITGNLYQRANYGYCSYSPFENLVDSLLAGTGDTTLVCTGFQKHFQTGTGQVTRFGVQIKTKSFRRDSQGYSIGTTYGKNFGIIFTTYSDQWGLAGESLTGCFINGVLYGDTTLTGVDIKSSETPNEFNLHQNYPNPFNPKTIINYELRIRNFVMLKVYDIAGKKVATLVNDIMPAGKHAVEFNAADLSSGVYFCIFRTEGFEKTMRMVVVK